MVDNPNPQEIRSKFDGMTFINAENPCLIIIKSDTQAALIIESIDNQQLKYAIFLLDNDSQQIIKQEFSLGPTEHKREVYTKAKLAVDSCRHLNFYQVESSQVQTFLQKNELFERRFHDSSWVQACLNIFQITLPPEEDPQWFSSVGSKRSISDSIWTKLFSFFSASNRAKPVQTKSDSEQPEDSDQQSPNGGQ